MINIDQAPLGENPRRRLRGCADAHTRATNEALGMRPNVRSGDALFAFRPDLTISSWNTTAEELTGIPADEAVGRPCWEVLRGHDTRGNLVCHRGCSVARLARDNWSVRCQALVVETPKGRRTVNVSTIALDDGDAREFLHVLVPDGEPSPPERELLTPRQREVLQLLAQGVTAKEIATGLGIAQVTARNHIRAILVVLGAHSQLEALANARRLHLID
jgi:DNA-binding CsgD family transcriptional regulator